LIIIFLLRCNAINSLTLFVVLIAGIITSILSKKYRIPLIYQFLKTFERKETIKSFPGRGTISFFIGCLLVLQLFEKNTALASIMILTLGDSISHLVGWHIGRRKNPLNCLKSVEGNIAGAIAGSLGAMFFVSPLHAVIASFTAMTAEAVEIKMQERIVDDNITVPLVAGTVLHLLSKYL